MVLSVEPTEVQPIQYSGEYLRIEHTRREVLLLQGSVVKKTLGVIVSMPSLLGGRLHDINDSDFAMLTWLAPHTIDRLIPELHRRGIDWADLTGLGLYKYDNGKKLLQSALGSIQPITLEWSLYWSREEIINFVQKQFAWVSVEEANVNLWSPIYWIENTQQRDRIMRTIWSTFGKDVSENHIPMTEWSRQEKIHLLKNIFLTQSLQNNGNVLAYVAQSPWKNAVLSIVKYAQVIDNYGREGHHFFMLQQSSLFTQSGSWIVKGALVLDLI